MYIIRHILILSCLSIICCKNEKKNQIIKENLNIDSLSMVSIVDARFGMSKHELGETNVFKDASFSSDYISFDFEIDNESFSGRADLSNNILHTVSFFSEKEVANKLYDYLNPYGDKLKKYFEKEYGEPDYSNYPLAYDELKESEITPMYKWEIGDKNIEIGIFRNFPYYITICSITNRSFKEQLNE